jgi:hypothetical protein
MLNFLTSIAVKAHVMTAALAMPERRMDFS